MASIAAVVPVVWFREAGLNARQCDAIYIVTGPPLLLYWSTGIIEGIVPLIARHTYRPEEVVDKCSEAEPSGFWKRKDRAPDP